MLNMLNKVRRTRFAAVLIPLTLVGALLYAPTAPALATTASLISAVGAAVGNGDWPMYGHDPARTNFNPAETAINRSTVDSLRQIWQANIGSNGVAPSGASSVANGRVYVASSVAGSANFFAFNAASGSRVWAANVGHKEVSCFNIGIGATPAVSGDVVVAGGGDAAYYGLNATTGTQIWRSALNVGSSGFPWASPLIAGSRVYLGVS